MLFTATYLSNLELKLDFDLCQRTWLDPFSWLHQGLKYEIPNNPHMMKASMLGMKWSLEATNISPNR